jgi:hypothetical protein
MRNSFFTALVIVGLVVLAKLLGYEGNHLPLAMGITTLGLFGSGEFETDEAPKNWREAILYLFPNGDAPLTALLSMAGSEGTDSSTFNWWEKGLISFSTTLTADNADVNAVSIEVADSSMFGDAQQLFNPRTNEVMLVNGDPANATHVTVVRGSAGSTKVALLTGDVLFVIGTVYAEGTGSGKAIYTGPGKQYNYTQIFKRSVEITESANKETTRTGNKYEDMKEETLRQYSTDTEMAYLFGKRHEDTGANGKPRRWSGGLDTHFIATNRFDAVGTMTKTLWNNWMEQLFAYGSEERLLLAGRSFIRYIHEMIQANTQYQIANETVYGVKLQRIITPYGDLLLKRHPLFSGSNYLRGYGIALDVPNIKERTFREMTFKENVQDNDADEKKDMFIGEHGLEVNHEKTHAVFENILDYNNI